MPQNDPTFDALVKAGRDLLASSSLVTLQRWALAAGVSHAAVKTDYLAVPARRSALEQAIGGRCVDAEGGCFLMV